MPHISSLLRTMNAPLGISSPSLLYIKMIQILVGILALAYSAYAQWKLKQDVQIDDQIAHQLKTKIKIGFQLQMALLQFVSLVCSSFEKSVASSFSSLCIIIALLYSFAVTIQHTREPCLYLFPLLLVSNYFPNFGISRVLDGLCVILSLMLSYYQASCSDSEDKKNILCKYLETEGNLFTQYILLLKFQPVTYYDYLPMPTESNVKNLHYESISSKQNSLACERQNPSQRSKLIELVNLEHDVKVQIQRETESYNHLAVLKQQFEERHMKATGLGQEGPQLSASSQFAAQSCSPPQLHHAQQQPHSQSQQLAPSPRREEKFAVPTHDTWFPKEQACSLWENEGTEELGKKNARVEKQPSPETSRQQVFSSDREGQDAAMTQMSAEQIETLKELQIENVDVVSQGSSQPFEFIEQKYGSSVSAIQELDAEYLENTQIVAKRKKPNTRNLHALAKKNKMMKRIKSHEDFMQQLEQLSSKSINEDRSEFERYKEEINSVNLAEEDFESQSYLSQRVDKIKFEVIHKIVQKVINKNMKHFIAIVVSVGQETWRKHCLYGELFELSKGYLPESDSTEEKSRHFNMIQMWLDMLSANPVMLKEEVLSYFQVPQTIINKYCLIQKIAEEKGKDSLSVKSPQKIIKQPQYYSLIKNVKAECVSHERSLAMADVIYYTIKFTLQIDEKQHESECKRTLEEIKETCMIIKKERNLTFRLQEQDTIKAQIKAINEYLQELFSHSFYYCDALFEAFDILHLAKKG